MNPLPFPTYNMNEADVNSVLEIYDALKKSGYSSEFDFDFTFDFTSYASFEGDNIPDTGPVMRFSRSDKIFYLDFIRVEYYVQRGKYSSGYSGEFQTWGVYTLKNNYGHILIKPETILDKIHDLINPIELDFTDDKEFNKKFYVITDDRVKANLLLTQGFRNCIETIATKEFILEILNNKLIIGDKKVINPTTAIELVEFMNTLSRNF